MTSDAAEVPEVDVIVDECSHSGIFNMSMDAALLHLSAERVRSVVRIYQWSEPTVTLGYFQAMRPAAESPFSGLPIVRRLSGGGAILHDQEITYSLILPASHPARQSPSDVYETVHRAIIAVLSAAGVTSQLRGEYDATNRIGASVNGADAVEPFLCFLRQNANDILHSCGAKIVGSAQRRRKGVTLQHGSIILKASRLVPHVLGIVDLEPSFLEVRFRQILPQAIADAISHSTKFRHYTKDEKRLAATIATESEYTVY